MFVLSGVQERYEHGYLDPYRLSATELKHVFEEEGEPDYVVYPYFIYYFDCLKQGHFLQWLYVQFLKVLNLLLHKLGNRVIVVICFRKGGGSS